MNDNEIADHVRNDRTRHPELDSGSKRFPDQARNDKE